MRVLYSRYVRRWLCLYLSLIIIFALCSTPVKADDEPDMSKQNAITAYALSFANNPDLQYVFGGYGGRYYSYNGENGENNGYWSLEQCMKYIDDWSTNPNENQYKPYGTDCSGFLMGIFQHFGIDAHKNRFQDNYPAIREEDAVPGDVVTYADWNEETKTYEYQHVGMYLGDGLIIHLSTRRGYSGRETPYDGYTTSSKTGSPTYPHISRVNYWSTAKRYWCRVVDDWSQYQLSTSEQNEAQEVLSGLTIQEYELTGMPSVNYIDSEASKLLMADRSDLSMMEEHSLESIKGNMPDKQSFMDKFVGGAFSFVGIAILVYSVLLILAFAFDKVNTFIDLGLVTLLTFGGVRLLSKEDLLALPEKERKKYSSTNKFFCIVGLLIAIGILLLSGVVMRAIYLLLSWL